ncbi:Sec-independent protein translocase TatB [Xylanimonas allomyrinae]|uniref:Sec-independent protein translocase TatB n=1 Tax=Xylanimonas allomyrinae TaxID=2509459 RepID=A0A4P6EHM3_9MICO|nr:Sec-independent protein translocase TatB [Xylanimonas allomyrinae]QAY62030.1 Sec-independent protein translocase TatB [Xylanimonas allomyrinae]
MLFDINGGEALIIVVLALVLVGPERLPQYAAQLARLVRRAKSLLADARERVTDELGPEVADVDWSKLDPRQYDPRRIVREALLDDGPLAPGAKRPAGRDVPAGRAAAAGTAAGAAAGRAEAVAPAAPDRPGLVPAGDPAPFDADAT